LPLLSCFAGATIGAVVAGTETVGVGACAATVALIFIVRSSPHLLRSFHPGYKCPDCPKNGKPDAREQGAIAYIMSTE
jgi:hypothetical protein